MSCSSTHAIAHRIGGYLPGGGSPVPPEGLPDERQGYRAGGLPPEQCLAVTFTRRARDRLTALLGAETTDRVTVATFHGLGLLILREQCKLLGIDAGLKVADERTRKEVLRSLSPGASPAALGAKIAATKRTLASSSHPPSSPSVQDVPAEDEALAARYDAALRERGLVDVDDLVPLPVTLLDGDPALAAAYQARWTDVFVDEYQDVDEQQYLLLRLLTSPGSRVCAIGDPDQAIYGFRGGDVGYFLRFQSDFESARTVRLSRSYRSAPTIVRSAMQLIRPGTLVPGRELVPARTDIADGPVTVHAVADEREEAEAVAASIETMLGGASFHALDSRAVDGRDRAVHQLSFADFAVLYRTSAQAAAIGEALTRRGFPFQRRSHARLAEMPGVPEILAAIGTASVLAPGAIASDDVSASAPDPPAQVPVTEALAEAVRVALAACDGGPTADAADSTTIAAAQSAARAAIRAAADVLAPLAARCGSDVNRFADEVALGAEVDTWDPRADRITLLTLHAAKGLEFPVVFIAGCDDGLLPLRPWRGAEIDYAEERLSL